MLLIFLILLEAGCELSLFGCQGAPTFITKSRYNQLWWQYFFIDTSIRSLQVVVSRWSLSRLGFPFTIFLHGFFFSWFLLVFVLICCTLKENSSKWDWKKFFLDWNLFVKHVKIIWFKNKYPFNRLTVCLRLRLRNKTFKAKMVFELKLHS